MIKNDINLIQRRKNQQYSSKSLAVTITLVAVLGVGIFLGITLPSKNLSQTKEAVARLNSELQQYSGIALSASGSSDEAEATSGVSIDTLYIEKAKTLSSLEEQLESLMILETAQSNALVYINAIEAGIPKEANITSLSLVKNELSIYGSAMDDAAVAEFTVKLRECGLFEEVFVASSMVAAPGSKSCVFNITATLAEPLNTRPMVDTEDESTADNGGGQ